MEVIRNVHAHVSLKFKRVYENRYFKIHHAGRFRRITKQKNKKIVIKPSLKKAHHLRIMTFIFIILLFCSMMVLYVSVPGKEIFGCAAKCAQPNHSAPESVRIISLNVLHDFPYHAFLPERFDQIGKEILLQDADIVLLQEVPWQHNQPNYAESLAETVHMNYLYFRANGNRKLIGFEEGVAIFSRYPLNSAAHAVLEPKAGIFENRTVLHATAETPIGELDLFVTHLTGSDLTTNSAQVSSLQAFVDAHVDHTAVIAGDFNVDENTPQIQKLSEEWIDSYRLFHPTEPGWTCCHASVTETAVSTLSERIDYLFIRPYPHQTVEVVDVQRLFDTPSTSDPPLWVSDHAGLIVTLKLTEE